MSREARDAIWACRRYTGSRLVVAIALADFASPTGGDIFPGTARLLAKTNLSRSQLQRHMKALREDGVLLLVRRENNAERRSREYALDLALLARMADAATSSTSATGRTDATGSTSAAGPVAPMRRDRSHGRGGTGSMDAAPTLLNPRESEENTLSRASPRFAANYDGGLDEVEPDFAKQHPGQANSTKRARLRKQWRRAHGLCAACGRNAVAHGVNCDDCRERNRSARYRR